MHSPSLKKNVLDAFDDISTSRDELDQHFTIANII